MKTSEKVKAFLQKHIPEDAFTPEVIAEFEALELDSTTPTPSEDEKPEEAETEDSTQKAIEEALKKSDEAWSKRFRDQFFGKNEKQQEPEDDGKLPGAVEDETIEEDSFDSIFNDILEKDE